MAGYHHYVLRSTGRWRADLPAALALLCVIAFGVGIGDASIRRDLGLYVWGSLGAAAVLGGLWWVGWRSLRWELTADERGVRLWNRAGVVHAIDGPRAIRFGRLEARRARAPLTLRMWVAVESADRRWFVFERPTGPLDRIPDGWPAGTPPETGDTFASLGFDPAAFLDALGGPRPA